MKSFPLNSRTTSSASYRGSERLTRREARTYATRFKLDKAKVTHGTDIDDGEALKVLRLALDQCGKSGKAKPLTSSMSALVAAAERLLSVM
jgi:hypothetical protein